MSVGIALKRGVDKVGPMAVWAARALEALAICTGEDCACTPTQVRTDNLFCFQAEDGIRDYKVTGVQTCALPISLATSSSVTATVRILSTSPTTAASNSSADVPDRPVTSSTSKSLPLERSYVNAFEIGRASCRERV